MAAAVRLFEASQPRGRSRLPIIAVSAMTTAEDKERALVCHCVSSAASTPLRSCVYVVRLLLDLMRCSGQGLNPTVPRLFPSIQAVGFDDFLPKPISREGLVAKLLQRCPREKSDYCPTPGS